MATPAQRLAAQQGISTPQAQRFIQQQQQTQRQQFTSQQQNQEQQRQQQVQEQLNFFNKEIEKTQQAIQRQSDLGVSGSRKAQLEAKLEGLIKAKNFAGETDLKNLKSFAKQVENVKRGQDVASIEFRKQQKEFEAQRNITPIQPTAEEEALGLSLARPSDLNFTPDPSAGIPGLQSRAQPSDLRPPRRDFVESGLDLGERIVSFPVTVASESFRKAEESFVQERRIGSEFFGGRNDLAPFESRGTVIVTQQTPLTDDELKALPFQGGAEELARRRKSENENILRLEQQDLIKNSSPKFEKEIDNKVKELTNKVQEGKLSQFEAQEILETFVSVTNEKFNLEINRKLSKKSDELNKKTLDELKKAEIDTRITRNIILAPAVAATGFGLGLVATAAPATAPFIITGSTVLLARQTPRIISDFGEAPLQTGVSLGIGLTAGAVGGLAGGRVGGNIRTTAELESALSRARVSSKVVGKDLDFGTFVKRYKVNPGDEALIKSLTDRGFKIREVRSKLITDSSKDAKILPKVEGKIFEIVSRDGTVVERINAGDFIARKGKDVYSRQFLQEVIAKLDESKQTTRSVEATLKNGKLQRIEEVKTFQDTQAEVRKLDDTTRLITGKSFSRPISNKPVESFGDVPSLIRGRLFEKKPSPKAVSKLLKEQEAKAGTPDSITKFIFKEKLGGFGTKTKGISIGDDFFKATFGERGASARITTTTGQAVTELVSGKGFKSFKGKKSTTPKGSSSKSKPSIDTNVPSREGNTLQDSFQKQTTKGSQETTSQDFGILRFASDIAKVTTKPVNTFVGGLVGDTKTREKEIVKTTDRQTLLDKQREKSKTKVNPLQGTGLLNDQLIDNRTKTTDIFGFSTAQPQATVQRTAQKQITTFGFQSTAPGIGIGFTPTVPKTPTPLILKPPREEEDRRRVPAYKPQVKHKGKFIDVSKKATSKTSALSKAARVVDNTTAKTGRVIKTDRLVKKPKKEDKFFKRNMKKFRMFREQRGSRKKLKNEFIERRQFAIDTPGEKKKLSALSFIGKRRSQSSNKRRKSDLRNTLGF